MFYVHPNLDLLSFQTAEAVWAVNNKSGQFDAQSAKTICFHLPVLLSRFHNSVSPCQTEASFWSRSQHGWQWGIWWHSQVEMNTLSPSLPVTHRWIAEMKMIYSGWNRPKKRANWSPQDQTWIIKWTFRALNFFECEGLYTRFNTCGYDRGFVFTVEN